MDEPLISKMMTLSAESRIKVLGGKMHFYSTPINAERNTLLFLHGLGESVLSFMEAFQEPALREYNILVPDLLGFGNSSAAFKGGYSFNAQVRRVVDLLDIFSLESVHLIGHSMGGDIGTRLCNQHPNRIKSFVNIEGDLTPGDRFITNLVVDANKQRRFKEWFCDELIGKIVLNQAVERMSWCRYLASLLRCRPKAFLASALEIYDLNELSSDGESEIGKEYRSVSVKKVYCWGTESLSDESQEYLKKANLLNHAFEGAAHWVMQDKREAFYGFLAEYLVNHM